jgi:hypothetical protein
LEELTKEKNGLEDMMSHLETEYRKANISEESYSELKEKYSKRLEELNKELGIKKTGEPETKKSVKQPQKTEIEEVKEETPEEEKPGTIEEETNKENLPEETPKKLGFLKKLFSGKKEKDSKGETSEEIKEEKPETVEESRKTEEEEPEVKKEEKPKIGIFGKILGKKEKTQEAKPEETEKKEEKSKKEEELEVGEIGEMTPEVIEKLARQVAEASGTTETKTPVEEETSEDQAGTGKDIEIEKLRVMIDATREANRTTDETIRTISESIGELRSMVFQADASLKESTLKMEKIEDEIGEVKPQEIVKKFRGLNETIEKQQINQEKLERKSEDLAEKVNKVYEMLKGIGGIENLIQLNKNIQEKLTDINEAVKYIERLGAKTEKIFIDLNKNLEDFVLYKTKQEDVEESLKDIIKSIDALNVKFEGYVNKKDLETFKEDDMIIKKQLEEINKVLPLVKVKLPDRMANLRREKEDIILLLDSIKEQLERGNITKEEYQNVKSKNISKVKIIDNELNKEWKKIENLVKLTEDLLELEEKRKSEATEIKEKFFKEESAEVEKK